MNHAWRLTFLVFPLAGAFVWGCSGDDAVTFNAAAADASDDGGSDATSTDEGGQDAASGLDAGLDSSAPLACPTYTGADPYCKSVNAYCTRCVTQLTACEIQNVANCEQLSQILSPTARTAASDCVDKAACGGDDAGSRCVLQKLSKVAPSASQTKLAQDYCNACPGADAPDQCAADFYFKADSGVPGKGELLIELDDQLIDAIDKRCIAAIASDAGDGGAAGCATKFATCAGLEIAKVAPADACKDGGK
jgi:hypothetical protein